MLCTGYVNESRFYAPDFLIALRNLEFSSPYHLLGRTLWLFVEKLSCTLYTKMRRYSEQRSYAQSSAKVWTKRLL